MPAIEPFLAVHAFIKLSKPIYDYVAHHPKTEVRSGDKALHDAMDEINSSKDLLLDEEITRLVAGYDTLKDERSRIRIGGFPKTINRKVIRKSKDYNSNAKEFLATVKDSSNAAKRRQFDGSTRSATASSAGTPASPPPVVPSISINGPSSSNNTYIITMNTIHCDTTNLGSDSPEMPTSLQKQTVPCVVERSTQSQTAEQTTDELAELSGILRSSESVLSFVTAHTIFEDDESEPDEGF